MKHDYNYPYCEICGGSKGVGDHKECSEISKEANKLKNKRRHRQKKWHPKNIETFATYANKNYD